MHWNPDPVLLVVGPLTIHWYGALFTLGLLMTIWVGFERFKERGIPESHPFALAFVLPLGLFIGAHIGHSVFYNFDRLLADPAILLDPRTGLSSHGGAVGTVLAAWIFCKVKKANFRQYLDIGGLAALWLFPPIRIGNFINSEVVGRETDVPWGVIFEGAGYLTPRHPVQLYEAALAVGLIIWSLWLNKQRDRMKHGATFLLIMFVYFSIRTVLEFFKEVSGGGGGIPVHDGAAAEPADHHGVRSLAVADAADIYDDDDPTGVTTRLCSARPISPRRSWISDCARPTPSGSAIERAASPIHSSTGWRCRCTVRSALGNANCPVFNAGHTPLPASATVSTRCSGVVASPATSGCRMRIQAVQGPWPHVPSTMRISTAVW